MIKSIYKYIFHVPKDGKQEEWTRESSWLLKAMFMCKVKFKVKFPTALYRTVCMLYAKAGASFLAACIGKQFRFPTYYTA